MGLFCSVSEGSITKAAKCTAFLTLEAFMAMQWANWQCEKSLLVFR